MKTQIATGFSCFPSSWQTLGMLGYDGQSQHRPARWQTLGTLGYDGQRQHRPAHITLLTLFSHQVQTPAHLSEAISSPLSLRLQLVSAAGCCGPE